MKKRQYSIAMCILLSLGLAACSSGGSATAPAKNNLAASSTSGTTETVTTNSVVDPTKKTETTALKTSDPESPKVLTETPKATETVDSTITNPETADSTSSENPSDTTANNEQAIAERNAIEYALGDKTVKWRQIKDLLSSSLTYVNNPLHEDVDGKISPVKGAAAYLNGYFKYDDKGVTKDMRDAEESANLKWDKQGFSTAEINPDKLQTLDVTDENGDVLAKFHFVNQKNATYFNWKSQKNPVEYDEEITTAASGYLAIPTPADEDMLRNKGKATYRGHIIANRSPESNQFNLGNLELEADFDAMTIQGKITGRNDTLLDHVADRNGGWGSDEVTTDPEAVDEGVTLVSQDVMNERIQAHRTKDITLTAAEIWVENGVASFKNTSGMEYTAHDGSIARTGIWGGVFAGDKAQEVVGEIQGSGNFASFGATEVAK